MKKRVPAASQHRHNLKPAQHCCRQSLKWEISMRAIGKVYLASAAAALLLINAPGLSFAETAHSTPHQTNGSASTSPDTKPMQDLMQAAQRLRDATHDMVREQATVKRNDSIRSVDKTLNEVQDAMVSLPSDLMLANTNESESKKATENVARAADELNKAVTALNGDTKAGNRDQSIKAIKQALAQIQQERMKISANAATTGSASHSSGSK
jgi:hypothetical protein